MKFEQPSARELRSENVIGGEVITPAAVEIDEKRPDGSVDTEPARQRGWLSAMASAYYRSELSEADRRKNVQEIVEAAVAAGVPKSVIKPHLESLGINVVPKNQP